jgi:5-methylcytosine-specific restriction endonuclease McrA
MGKGVYVRTAEHKKQMSERAKRLGYTPPSRKGTVVGAETRKKVSESLKGIKHSEDAIKRRSTTNRNNFDKRGRKTPQMVIIRNSVEYKLWREAVFTRDNWTCIWCNKKGGWCKTLKKKIVLNADHIKPFAHYPELRFAIDNGRTLCFDCHKTTDTYGYRSQKQFIN